MTHNRTTRLERLLGYLKADPNNSALLADAVQAALDADELDQAEQLGRHLQAVTPGGFEGRYLAAVTAMRRRDFESAAGHLDTLMTQRDQPSVRFNLAWSRAMLGDKATALALLDDPTTEEIAAASMLKLQLLHEAAQLEEALAIGQVALEHHPDDAGLLAAMATLALDLEDSILARRCALRAGDHPEALAAAGMLDLQDGSIETAEVLFDKSLAARDHNPRAWIGRGLAGLLRRNPQAALDLDRGAQQFGSHVGSWIAAGWGHFIAGDVAAAQERFQRAMEIDPTFAESHGSLAVVDIAAGRMDEGRRRTVTALRLDRDCFSAALAQVMLLSDDPAKTQEIVARAMHTPLNEEGMTIAGYMAGLSRPTLH